MTTSLTDIILYGSAEDLTDDHIRRLQCEPDLLDLINERESLSSRSLWSILGIAAVLMLLSKIIAVKMLDEYEQLFVDVSVDLVFEMGAALIGSVATVIFIEHREKRQTRENIRFRSAVQKRIKAVEAVSDSS
ncbi:MAG: hypothetical protein CR993_06510 [Rhodobacterales bacterium]|nr:MAG: hypothetical protein CR993_06510 [Rhodobacterales bacterium]